MPGLARTHRDWHIGRNRFNEGLRRGEPAVAEKWQKTYYRGLMPERQPDAGVRIARSCGCSPSPDRRRAASAGGGDGWGDGGPDGGGAV